MGIPHRPKYGNPGVHFDSGVGQVDVVVERTRPGEIAGDIRV